MYRYILPLLMVIFYPQFHFSQETSIQFPRLNFHMKMNQNLRPSISYFAQTDIIVGDKSGIIFTLAVDGDDLNLQSDINNLIKLNTLKFSISPSSQVDFHAFYGRYKYLGEDPVLPNGVQYNYSPNTDFYGFKSIFGSGIAVTMPILDGRYEPEFVIYSDSFNGIDYLNTLFIMTIRYELWTMELYAGMSIPTIGAIDNSLKGNGGFTIFTTMDLINVYFSFYVPSHFGDTFEMDDIYFRFSQHLLVNNFEQTFSLYSLGSESGNLVDPLIGLNSIPDLNLYLSLGGRINNIGFGVEYGFIYGLYRSEARVDNLQRISNRLGAYTDVMFLGLTYKLGLFYTLPNSAAYIRDISAPSEVGFYVSIFGRS
ncbi:MAG: hypothetical protein ACRCWI_06455 [Brevinema sp.]